MPVNSPAARREWKRLEVEHAWLREALERLRRRESVGTAELDTLRARLEAHRHAVAAWRVRYLGTRGAA